ncbi:hypothetical protein DXG01_008539 [Tephrocybe rancida]|nr:hypothetical protein DXG01_008539 [Tephrocybe rancida]
MGMKEIVYIQAGNLSNYAGTHFWNTQESYLAEDDADSAYDFDVSFREGLSLTGRPTFCPRLLVFDYKSNFGTLAKSNALLGTDEDESLDEDSPMICGRNGQVSEYRQDRISKSAYHSSLDKPDDREEDTTEDSEHSQENIRYWSDFNRVYYVPRTVQKIPDPAEWENVEVLTLIPYVRQDDALMEGSLRLFLEECDSPQGLQIMNDTSTFGGFIHSFLTSFRDQYTKLPCLVVPLLSNGTSGELHVDDAIGIKNVVNDALYLRSLNEIASMSIPIQYRSAWPMESWNQRLSVKVCILPSLLSSQYLCNILVETTSNYHASAILSALVESVTVPLRLRASDVTLSSLSGRLNWRGNTPFSELSGIFPFSGAAEFGTGMTSLSTPRVNQGGLKFSPFTRWDVTRGFTPSGIFTYEEWSSCQSLQDTFVSTTHAASYPIPTSFPAFFISAEGTSSARKGILSRPENCSIFSSLSTSARTSRLFSSHATAIDAYLKRKPAIEALGFDGDDLRDLANDLWTLHDNFGGENNDQDGSLGEDE